MTQPKPLNRFEVWVSERAGPIFAVVALLIVLGAGAVFFTYQRSGDAQHDVNVLRPQVTRINRAVCDKGSLEHVARARRCAERIRVGLVNCRGSSRCRAALLAIVTYPPPARGATSLPGRRDTPATSTTTEAASTGDTTGGAQAPSQAHVSPGSGHDTRGTHEKTPKTPPTASPAPSPPAEAPKAPEPSPPPEQGQESGGSGAQGTPEGSSSSGAGVEVCVLKGTCVGVQLGLGAQ